MQPFGSWNKLSPNQAPWKGKYNYFEPDFPHGCVNVYLLIIKKWMARATASFIMIERAFCAIVLAALSGRFSLQSCDSSSTHHQKLAQNHISTRIERQSWACWYAGWRKKIPEFLFRGKRKTTSSASPHWSASFKANAFHGSVPCLPATTTKSDRLYPTSHSISLSPCSRHCKCILSFSRTFELAWDAFNAVSVIVGRDCRTSHQSGLGGASCCFNPSPHNHVTAS